MFITFTDSEFDGNVENAVDNVKSFWPELKAAGAVIMRPSFTEPNTIRTKTLWRSQEEVDANLNKIRAAAGSAVGMSVTGEMQGDVLTGSYL